VLFFSTSPRFQFVFICLEVAFVCANEVYPWLLRFHLGRQPLVIVADPELCREVGVRQFKLIPNRSLPAPIAGSPLHQKGLFFTR
jgi:hypothetical protein